MFRMRYIYLSGLAFFAFILSPMCAKAQLSSSANEADMAVALDAASRGAYLEAVQRAKDAAFDKDNQIKDPFAVGTWRLLSSWAGGEAPPKTPAQSGNLSSELNQIKRAVAHDALREIVQRARRTRIVILNEDHIVPRDRAFALKVARALKPLGYRYLAIEALTNGVDQAGTIERMRDLASRGYIRLDDGFLTKDPIFADFLNHSMGMGYQLVPYEYVSSNVSHTVDVQVSREKVQAVNIYNTILKNHPGAKVFIYVGFGHVAESSLGTFPDGRPRKEMAAWLKEISSINPLTIDQSSIGDSRSSDSNEKIYEAAGRKASGRSITLFDNRRPLILGRFHGSVDLQIVHPPKKLKNGRPDWMRAMGRIPQRSPAWIAGISKPTLLQVFPEKGSFDAVPLDQIMVIPGKAAPPLMVYHGPVRFSVQQ